MKAISRLSIGASVFLFSSCFSLNVFQPFDHPTSDPQLTEAARACLDKGDYSCALQDYEKLSSSSSDVANSEEAFTLYNNAGIDMGAFIGAFGGGGNAAGSGLTNIANAIPANVNDVGSGNQISTLLEIYHGYQKVQDIRDQSLRGIVRLVGAVGMMGAILGDMATTRGNLLTTDIATSPSACENFGLACGVTSTANPCFQPNDNVVTGDTSHQIWAGSTSTNDLLAQAGDAEITASFAILFTALQAAEQGLTDLSVSSGGASGLFGNLNAIGYAAATQTVPPSPDATSPCFRQLLLNEGIGGQ